jgi:hypothetical protein
MRARLVKLVVAVAAVGAVLSGAASAATWQPLETLALVRGVPAPQVAMYGNGSALAVYADRQSFVFDEPEVMLAGRRAGGSWQAFSRPLAVGTEPQVAASANGATAIAFVDDGRLAVASYPSPGPVRPYGAKPTVGRTIPIPAAGRAVRDPQVAIDDSGRVTVVWISPAQPDTGESLNQVEVVTVEPSGAVGEVTALGPPGDCHPALDVNGRGDAVVSGDCADRAADLYYRPAGDVFGTGEAPFEGEGHVRAQLDGDGNIHAFHTSVGNPMGKSEYVVHYALRPPAGPFGAPSRLTGVEDYAQDFDMEVFEDGRVVAAWMLVEDEIAYSIKPAGGPFSPVRGIATGGRANGMDLVASPSGPALISWRERLSDATFPLEQPMAAVLRRNGTTSVSPVGIAGRLATPRQYHLPFAINDSGQAAGAWEQRCSRRGAFALVGVALDEASSGAEPPCQDAGAPRVRVLRKRVLLSGRSLRVRVVCDENCRMVGRVRVLGQGARKPLATGRTRREQSLPANRGRWLRLWLTRTEARRVAAARAGGGGVTARLAFSARDRYGNGAVRRLRVPVRR